MTNATNGVKVSWAASGGATKYRVLRKVSGGKWARLADTTSTSYTDTKAVSGTTYYYTVACLNEAGNAFISAYDTTGKSVVYIAAPEVSVAYVTGGVRVSWTASAGATKYRVLRKESGGKWARLADTTSTSYTDKKAVSGTTYYYTVGCLNEAGNAFISAYDTTDKSPK